MNLVKTVKLQQFLVRNRRMLTDQQQIYLLAVNGISTYARNYGPRFTLLYGKDILMSSMIYSIHDYNSDEIQQLHNCMMAPEYHLSSIFNNVGQEHYEYGPSYPRLRWCQELMLLAGRGTCIGHW